DVSLDVDFFEAGGDSIRAAQLFSDVEREFGIVFPLTLLMEAGTIRALAAAIHRDRAGSKPEGGSTGASQMTGRPISEERILEIWRRLLSRDDLGPADDFFESGGDGTLALQMRAEIAAIRGTSFPLARLVAARTARDLATALDPAADVPMPPPSVVRLREGSSAFFFCFSGRGTDVLKFRLLADHLDPGIGMCAGRGFGLAGGPLPPPDMILLIELALEEIRAFQLTGPYALGGHSGGGQLALEIAGRLREQGEAVSLVFMIDTARAESMVPNRPPLRERIASLRRHFRHHLRGWLNMMTRRIRRLRGILGFPVPKHRPNRWAKVGDIYIQAAKDHRTRPYDGKVVYYRPFRGVNKRRPATGWESLLSDFEVVSMPGGHISVLEEPHVAVLARDLSMRLLAD
ncbi:MAG TPA: phosphopantetheine-binding protein, partial [Thermoanaerobaculia bacterium]|nr:phosphopantetheine-binding protein [Thermoanaerobaculia bacterium]